MNQRDEALQDLLALRDVCRVAKKMIAEAPWRLRRQFGEVEQIFDLILTRLAIPIEYISNTHREKPTSKPSIYTPKAKP